jgi:hypothetical protein
MMTRAQLMDFVLGQAGLNSDFYTLARGWINQVVLEQARNYDWPFYAKTPASPTAFVSGTYTYSVPSDFARPDRSLYLIQNNTRGAEIPVVDHAEFEARRQNASNGNPTVARIVTSMGTSGPSQVVEFDVVPNNSSSFRFPYFRLPTELSADNTDDSKIPDFLNQEVLIAETMRLAFEYQDDARFTQKMGEGQQKIREAKFNTLNETNPVTPLASNHFRRGRGRGGGGNGWMGP